MDQLETLKIALDQLRSVVAGLDESQMETATNCEPWTARQMASHAVNSQLLWVGFLSGTEIVSIEDTMSAKPYEGDLRPLTDDAIAQAQAAWGADGTLSKVHTTPFGELPGAAVINFPTIDAMGHAWDLANATGTTIEIPDAAIPGFAAVIENACTDGSRSMGLFREPADVPDDATATERLMAATGRTIPRH